jgi:tetratricopeptide (TPR) repeat protein
VAGTHNDSLVSGLRSLKNGLSQPVFSIGNQYIHHPFTMVLKKNTGTAATAAPSSKRWLWPYVLIAVLAAACYLNTLSHGYALDDTLVISENKFTKQGLAGIPELLSKELFVGYFGEEKALVAGGRYRPLSLVTFAVEYEFLGFSPGFSHFLNLLLYAATGLVLFRVLGKLFPESKGFWSIPLVASLLYVAHPLHTEVVANIKGRDELMAFLGALLAWQSSLRYHQTGNARSLWMAGVWYALGMFSKEVAVTFLAVVPLSIYFFLPISAKRLVAIVGSLAIPVFVYLTVRYLVVGPGQGDIAAELLNDSFLGMGTSERFATIFYTLLLYLKLLFWPHPLTYDYYPYHIERMDWSLWPVLSVALHAGLAAYAIWGLYRKRAEAFCIWLYAICLSPTSNVLFPIGVFMNERFVYAASLGFCLLLAYWMTRSFPARYAKWMPLALLAILLPYAAKSAWRNLAWKDSYTLLTTDVSVSKNSAKGNAAAGFSYYKEGIALEQLIQDPAVSSTAQIRAGLLANTHLEEAEVALLAGKPNVQQAKKALQARRDQFYAQALPYAEKAVQVYPAYIDGLFLLGNLHFAYTRQTEKGLACYRRLLARNPNHRDTYRSLGIWMKGYSDPQLKLRMFHALRAFQPQQPDLLYQLGAVHGKELQQLDSAVFYLKQAAELSPAPLQALLDLGVAHGMRQEHAQALQALQRALALQPAHEQALINTGVVYQSMGDIQKAQEYFGRAEALKRMKQAP